MAAISTIAAGARLLDIGIGTGTLAAQLAKRGARVSGIDVSKHMLARCQATHDDFELSVGSFTEIPYPDATFDIIVSSFAFHEVEMSRRSEASAEIARVLRPGGQLALLDIIFASAAAVANARAAIREDWDSDEDYPLIGQLDAPLRTNGFEDLRRAQENTGGYTVS